MAVRCMNCGSEYPEPPREFHENNYEGREIEICPACGCDIFVKVE